MDGIILRQLPPAANITAKTAMLGERLGAGCHADTTGAGNLET